MYAYQDMNFVQQRQSNKTSALKKSSIFMLKI